MKRVMALALFAAGCGPSSVRVRQAEGSTYNAPFAEVWSAVTSELRNFQTLAEENAVTGLAITNWRIVERTSENPSNQSSAAGTDPSQTQTTDQRTQESLIPGGVYLRYTARVKGPPWKVELDAEAGEYRPGYQVIFAFRHGVADEPTWLRGRLDAMRIAIHEHVRQYAIKTEPAESKVKEAEATPWDGLPAQQVIVAVHKAAKERSAAQVRAHAIDELTWSDAAAPSADVAAAMWSADPETMATLAKTLEAGCGASGQSVVCPAGAPTDTTGGPHAVFRQVGRAWKLVLYVSR